MSTINHTNQAMQDFNFRNFIFSTLLLTATAAAAQEQQAPQPKTDDADVGESAACYYRYADEEDPGESFEGCMEASGKGAKRVKTLCGQIQALVDAGLTGTDQVRDLDHCSEVKSKALYSCTDDEGVVYNYYVLDDDHVDLIVPDDKEATCKAFIAYENEDE